MADFDLDAARVFRAMEIADTNVVLRSISAIRIEPREAGGVWIVATDGPSMLIQRDLHGHAPRPLVATFWPQQAPRDPELGDEGYHWHGARVTFDDPGEEATLACVSWNGPATVGAWAVVEPLPADVIWPEWRKAPGYVQENGLLNKSGPEGLNPFLLAELTKGWSGFRLHEFGARHQSRVVLSDSDMHAIGVIMPRTCPQTDDAALHEWLRDIGRDDLIGGSNGNPS